MLENFNLNDLRFIPKTPVNEFLIEDAKAVEKESYIAERTQKIIIIMAHSFRNEAQNFLLKLFEEPPKNIKFLIVAPSKNLLLPTVRSRFICEKRNEKKQRQDINLNLKQLGLKEIFSFLQSHESLDKVELMELIANLSLHCVKEFNLSEKELELFYKAYELAKLNSKANILLSSLLLNLYEVKK
ncbi:DNA polymerase III subunit delta' [Campylobacter sp. US33a]|uniref:DNA polymerase III subunit delta n=1 Tax=Campylobacter sp. CCS1377 TaxID=3158229 RepID=A0AAU7E9E8_9BACT|nr:DNA polymerase III subunit delta' [Campylobacter sp. US33a]MCW1360037.1 DNA polymerase III subunit delta' [Campylobacter jejuni]